MGISMALESYLKENAGIKIPIKKVVEDLLAGGAVLGTKPKLNLRNVKITASLRKKLVQRDDDWNIWLAPTGYEPKPARGKKKDDAKPQP
jgi:hypothetical protein